MELLIRHTASSYRPARGTSGSRQQHTFLKVSSIRAFAHQLLCRSMSTAQSSQMSVISQASSESECRATCDIDHNPCHAHGVMHQTKQLLVHYAAQAVQIVMRGIAQGAHNVKVLRVEPNQPSVRDSCQSVQKAVVGQRPKQDCKIDQA